MTGDTRLTGDELARAIGVSAGTIRHWQQLGLVSDDVDGYGAQDLERARLVAFATGRGIRAETVATVNREQRNLLDRFIALGGPKRGVGRSITDAASSVGLDGDVAERVWDASGLTDQPDVFGEDLLLLETVKTALNVGFPVAALLQLLRVYADGLGRVADAESRLFHLHVHERLRQQGVEAGELAESMAPLTDSLIALIEPTILYFHRKAWDRATRDDMLLHLRQESMPAGDVGEIQITVLFVDLASFTPFAEAAGDAAAATMLDRFSNVTRQIAAAHHGRVVKQIGDEFMVVFDRPADAVDFGIELQQRASDDPELLGVRLGAHTGIAVYQEGDYVGATVNLAARVSAEARPGEFLVTAAVRAEVDASGRDLMPTGEYRLKGVGTPVELFSASRR